MDHSSTGTSKPTFFGLPFTDLLRTQTSHAYEPVKYDSDSCYIYCRVPARRGLQQTAWAATRHGARDPLVRPQVDQITT